MQFKYYANRYQRSIKKGFDRGIITDIRNVISDKARLKRCKMLKEASLRGEQDASEFYDKCKGQLNCINVHNIGNILENEFISTNYLAYDIDNIDFNTVKILLRYTKLFSNIAMISPSRRGIKLFFQFEKDTINIGNLKLLYKNFGQKLIQKINNDLGLNIKLDLSSNDYNRLCYIGQIFIHEENEGMVFKASEYYTDKELEEHTTPSYQSMKSSEFSTQDTLKKLNSYLDILEKSNKPIAMERYDMMYYGFSFASLIKKEGLNIEQAYEYFKRFMKIGEVDKISPLWITKSGSGHKYHLGNEFKTFAEDWGNGSFRSNTTIGTFFHNCKGLVGNNNKIIIKKY